jgi:hypothetical protein
MPPTAGRSRPASLSAQGGMPSHGKSLFLEQNSFQNQTNINSFRYPAAPEAGWHLRNFHVFSPKIMHGKTGGGPAPRDWPEALLRRIRPHEIAENQRDNSMFRMVPPACPGSISTLSPLPCRRHNPIDRFRFALETTIPRQATASTASVALREVPGRFRFRSKADVA